MGRARIVTLPAGPAIAGPQPNAVTSTQVTINVGGELEDGRAFFGTDAVRDIDSP
jgi:hypothetical protein